MFLNLLTPEQQRVFVQAAQLVAASDGVGEEEAALLEAIAAECALTDAPEPAEASETLQAAGAVFDSPASKKVFMLELAGVAAIDGRAYPSELELLGEFAQRVGLGEAELEESLVLASRGRQLVRDSETFISTGVASWCRSPS